MGRTAEVVNLLRSTLPVPLGKVGSAEVVRHEVTKDDENLGRMQAVFGGGGRFVEAGVYAGLKIDGHLVMSNTRDEIRDSVGFLHQVERRDRPSVLINGLGLGVTVHGAMLCGAADITVVEINPDVHGLVSPSFFYMAKELGVRYRVILGDALTVKWPPGSSWNVVWHDIWPDICADNLPDMKRLHRRYGRRCSWQGSWARHLCEAGR
jgi:hypothetical protein